MERDTEGEKMKPRQISISNNNTLTFTMNPRQHVTQISYS